VGKRSLFTNGGLCPFHSSCVPVSYWWWLMCTAESCGSIQYKGKLCLSDSTTLEWSEIQNRTISPKDI
jgi:hypothetical protein